MIGKPASHMALVKAAFFCTHPAIDGIDRALLAFFATYSTYQSGAKSHPGNVNLETALGLKTRQVQIRIKRNIKRGLLERTERGDGRGCASVYRVVFESPYFPDRAPGGAREWLIEKPRTAEQASEGEGEATESKPRTLECAVSSENHALEESKPRIAPPETAHCTGTNRALEEPKPRTLECATSRSHQNPTTIPPKPRTEIENRALPDGWKDWIFKTATTELGLPSRREEDLLQKLASREQFSFDYLKRAVLNFCNRPQGFGGLTKISPWGLFLKDADRYIGQAKAELWDSDSWREAHDPVYKAQLEASIRRQQAADLARRTAEPEPAQLSAGEATIEDLF